MSDEIKSCERCRAIESARSAGKTRIRFERDEARRQLHHAENNFLRLSKEFNSLKADWIEQGRELTRTGEKLEDASDVIASLTAAYEQLKSSAPLRQEGGE